MNRQPPPDMWMKAARAKDITPLIRIALLVVCGIVLILMAAYMWWRVM